jgi:outer membrane protein
VKRLFLVSSVLLSIQFSPLAADSTLSLDQAVALAVKNNLDLAQAQKDLEIARADLRAAYADMLIPTAAINGAFSYMDPAQSAAYPFHDNYSVGLQITRTLFAGGRYWFGREARQLAADFAEYKLKDKTKEVVRTTSLDFYNLLLLKEKLALALANDKSLKDHLESTRINYENGIASQLDYLRDQVRYKNNQPLVSEARDAYDIGRINFANSIGIPAAPLFEPLGDLRDSVKVAPVSTDEAVLLKSAMENDLSVRTAEYTIASNQAAAAVAASARSPVINSSFNYGYTYRVDFPAATRTFDSSWTFTLSCVIPLDAWIPYVSKVSNQLTGADELVAKNRLAREQAVQALETRVKSLLLSLVSAEQNVGSQSDNVTQAKLVLDMAAKQYREGSISSLDLSDAELSYNQAVTNYLQALYTRYSTILQLNDIMQ